MVERKWKLHATSVSDSWNLLTLEPKIHVPALKRLWGHDDKAKVTESALQGFALTSCSPGAEDNGIGHTNLKKDGATS